MKPISSIGKWIDDARSFGKTEAEKEYYEENARCILTVWGTKGNPVK
ncbi:alpha-N-acetylglucosaminidase C-terminal domain-containing protein [Bacteroides thetaiotaomicron]|nr:alpha-N-acetylglucosaminidase C-terminal domain-containing protein [Bacteroides thetaiotaomicron]MCS2399779.1 alpha-N-acetylglucosaminidase C-terminal domain-containing protein [Bacteroides thetaiotaomicron]